MNSLDQVALDWVLTGAVLTAVCILFSVYLVGALIQDRARMRRDARLYRLEKSAKGTDNHS